MHRHNGGFWVCTIIDVKNMLTKKELKKFNKWFIGQTGIVLDTGEFGYYLHDVERFIKQIRFGIPTYFD